MAERPIRKTQIFNKAQEAALGQGHSFEELLRVRYQEDRTSMVQIAKELGVNAGSVRHWLDQLGIQRRTNSENLRERWSDPEKRRAASEARRKLWEDPEFKAGMVKKIHSPGSDQKRSATHRKLNLDDPGRAKRNGELSSETWRTKRLTQLSDMLNGADPVETIKALHHDRNLPVASIARQLSISEGGLVRLMNQLGIERKKSKPVRKPNQAYELRVKVLIEATARGVTNILSEKERVVLQKRFGSDINPRTLGEIGTELGVSRERVRQIEEEALRKLDQVLRAGNGEVVDASELKILELPFRIESALIQAGYTHIAELYENPLNGISSKLNLDNQSRASLGMSLKNFRKLIIWMQDNRGIFPDL